MVVYLVKMLDRSNVELLILGTTFLKKLSIYKENKEKMAECHIVDKLAKFVPVRNDVLLMSVLRLLHNLSFDVQLRDDMVCVCVGGGVGHGYPYTTTLKYGIMVFGAQSHDYSGASRRLLAHPLISYSTWPQAGRTLAHPFSTGSPLSS